MEGLDRSNAKHRDGIAIGGAVCAMIALLLVLLPLINPAGVLSGMGYGAVGLMALGVPVGIVGVVLGTIGFFRARPDSTGRLIASGAILAGIAAILGFVGWLFGPGCGLPGC